MRINSNHEPYWDVIKRIITESDVVVEVLDARLIELSRNSEVESLIKEIGRPLIYAVNKSDLVSKKSLKKQLENIKGNIVFMSKEDSKSSRILLFEIKKAFRKTGKRIIPEKDQYDPKPEYREAKADIVVGILGYPNVGKSSIINKLCHKGKVKVSKKAGTTHGIQWVKLTDKIKLIDSPGVIPLKKDDEIRYSLISAKNPDKIKDPESVAYAIINLFIKNNIIPLEKFYHINIQDTDQTAILEQISNKKGHLLKGGIPDENRTYIQLIRDWQNGKLNL